MEEVGNKVPQAIHGNRIASLGELANKLTEH
jgi:hypothetical protein